MSPADPRLDAILRPRSIAVVGASRKPHSIGREILHNLIRFGFNGPVYPVNPALGAVHSIRAYPSLRDIPDPVDLAIIVVPRAAVPRKHPLVPGHGAGPPMMIALCNQIVTKCSSWLDKRMHCRGHRRLGVPG